MTKDDKKELERAARLLSEAQSIVQAMRDSQQEAFDELSEKAQEGDKGQKLEETIETLGEIDEKLDEADSELSGLITGD